MCCIFTTLLLAGPRLGAIVWWLINPGYWRLAFDGSILWPILGIIFAPWTLLMYMIVYPNGVMGWEWLWIGLGIFFDIAWWAGGGFGNRDRIPGYS